MTLEDHKKILDSILTATPDDQKAAVTGYLLSLETDYKEQLAKETASNGRIEALEKQNKDYAEVNMRMFLERQKPAGNSDDVGADTDIDTDGGEDTPPPAKLSYDDLVL